jgi:hypothetical protein
MDTIRRTDYFTGINMIAMDAASAGNGRYAGMFWVDSGDVKKAAKMAGRELNDCRC